MAKSRPDRVEDLLGYTSIRVNASRPYDGIPWLDSDQHFRPLYAVDHCVFTRGRLVHLDLALWRCQGKDVMQKTVLSHGILASCDFQGTFTSQKTQWKTFPCSSVAPYCQPGGPNNNIC